MNPRERLINTLTGQLPDRIPCSPDISNMVPCRLTGKPFWDIYLYQNPPLWKAHLDAIKYFKIDGGFELITYVSEVIPRVPPLRPEKAHVSRSYIVARDERRLATQTRNLETGEWDPFITLYWRDNPPTDPLPPSTVNLPAIPYEWEEIHGVQEWPTGLAFWKLLHEEMGGNGILGINPGCTTNLLRTVENIYSYYDTPETWMEKSRRMISDVEANMEQIARLEPKPDILFCGGSGTLVFQTPGIFRQLGLPILKRATELAMELGIPTHVHSCGPESALVKMAAEETNLTSIDPLEIPPMGDCNLAELKALYGRRLVLKGNLHTTDTMLRGTVGDVKAACKKAIQEGGEGGRFILSTGDQCGRDTPDENLFAMVEAAEEYGRY